MIFKQGKLSVNWQALSGFALLMLIPMALLSASLHQSDPDARFIRARELAFENNYSQARAICDEILAEFPEYHDARILKARTFAWEGDFNTARQLLRETRTMAPRNREALLALIDVEMWSENYRDAIRLIDLALAEQPNNTHLLYRKALALLETGDETAAVVILNQILTLDPSYTEAKDLLSSIQSRRLLNHFGAGYRGHYFFEQSADPWHLYYAELGRKTRFIGPLTARVNYASRYNINSLQIEVDAYPTVRPGTYLYLNAGYSPDADLFPVTRFGFELFQALPASWEISAGFRLLNFENKDLLILTGSLSKYYRQYYFSFRPYFSFSSVGSDPSAASYFLTMRRFLGSPDSHLSLIVGRGFSADVDKFQGGQIYDLGGTLFEAILMAQLKLSNRFLLKLGAGYKIYEQDAPLGNPVILEGGIIYRF